MQIGKLIEDLQASDASALALIQSGTQLSHEESEFIALKQENATLKNQVVQLKERINKLKTLRIINFDQCSTRGWRKEKHGERANKAKDIKKTSPPTPPRAKKLADSRYFQLEHHIPRGSEEEDEEERDAPLAPAKAIASYA